ncbi:MAG: HAD-IB family phosphatase [Nitrososphaerales archaeon]|nr:HAD-IB family phosphatase [Nitrososphaerales archaeon]
MSPGIRLASFDMDGTLLEEDSSWAAIHRFYGTTNASRESLRLYTEGAIDYEEFMRRDIAAWPKGVTLPELEAVLSGYRVRKEAPETLKELRRRGIEPALITSGIDILAKKVAEELGIKHWTANGLRFDSTGKILPNGVGRVDPTRKDLAYLVMLDSLKVKPRDTIAVGDTVYDLAFLKSARKGFLLAHSTRVSDPAIIHIEKLTDIFQHI